MEIEKTYLSFEEAKQVLLQNNEEFQKLYYKHRELDDKIVSLEEFQFLEPEDELREKQLKVDKLRLKDRMAEMINVYRERENDYENRR